MKQLVAQLRKLFFFGHNSLNDTSSAKRSRFSSFTFALRNNSNIPSRHGTKHVKFYAGRSHHLRYRVLALGSIFLFIYPFFPSNRILRDTRCTRSIRGIEEQGKVKEKDLLMLFRAETK